MKRLKNNVLKRWLDDNKVGMSDLAERTGLSRTTIYRHVHLLSDVGGNAAKAYNKETGIPLELLLED